MQLNYKSGSIEPLRMECKKIQYYPSGLPISYFLFWVFWLCYLDFGISFSLLTSEFCNYFLHSDLGSSFWGMVFILASTALLTTRIAAACFAVALLIVLFVAKNVSSYEFLLTSACNLQMSHFITWFFILNFWRKE